MVTCRDDGCKGNMKGFTDPSNIGKDALRTITYYKAGKLEPASWDITAANNAGVHDDVKEPVSAHLVICADFDATDNFYSRLEPSVVIIVRSYPSGECNPLRETIKVAYCSHKLLLEARARLLQLLALNPTYLSMLHAAC